MHPLEYELLNLSVELEKGTIGIYKAIIKLRGLASESHNYIYDPELPVPDWNRGDREDAPNTWPPLKF